MAARIAPLRCCTLAVPLVVAAAVVVARLPSGRTGSVWLTSVSSTAW